MASRLNSLGLGHFFFLFIPIHKSNIKNPYSWSMNRPEGFNVDKSCSTTATDKSDVKCKSIMMGRLGVHSENKEQENHVEEESSSEDEGLPPLEANCNRLRPREMNLTSEDETSDSDS